MRFENPEAFLLFFPVLIVFMFLVFRERRRVFALQNSFALRNLKKMGLDDKMSLRGFVSRLSFFLFLACIVISLARPQMGQGEREEVTSEHSIVFLIDLSRSMLARDVSPSRLRLTKKEIIKSFKRLNSVKVGIVAFAGNAAVISPMTSDLTALEIYIDSLSTTTIASQGTEIFGALAEAKLMFDRIAEKEGTKKTGEKVIVLFSDGENHQEESIDMVKFMAKEGYRIFSVGVGTESGGYIPQFEDSKSYIKTAEGQLAVTKPNYKFLKKIARAGKGSFYSLNPNNPFSLKLESDLKKIDAVNNSKRKFVVKNEVFQFPLYIGVLFLFGYLILRRKR